MKTAVLFFLVVCLSSIAHANFAMDPQRKADPAFAKFFLNRADRWFRTSVYDYRESLSASDRRFVDAFLADPHSLGEKMDGAFLRTYSFEMSVEGDLTEFKSIRFIRPYPTPQDQHLFADSLRSRSIHAPSDQIVGLGFTRNHAELEVITSGGRLMKVITYRGSKLVSQVAIERGVATSLACPAAPSYDQVDRTTDAGGKTRFVYHANGFVDEALSLNGRRFIHKVELGLELSPGVIDYVDQTHYDLQYP